MAPEARSPARRQRTANNQGRMLTALRRRTRPSGPETLRANQTAYESISLRACARKDVQQRSSNPSDIVYTGVTGPTLRMRRGLAQCGRASCSASGPRAMHRQRRWRRQGRTQPAHRRRIDRCSCSATHASASICMMEPRASWKQHTASGRLRRLNYEPWPRTSGSATKVHAWLLSSLT